MKRKNGSAIITVVVAIVILVVLALSFIGSKRERAGISKMLSDEKKCEALAESAADYILSYLKKKANVHDNAENGSIYYMLRAPLKYAASESDFKDGVNIKLNTDDAMKITNLDDHVGFSVALAPVIEDLGWKDKVDIQSRCEICSAEAFAPASKNYRVSGINREHLAARGVSAKFLDSEPSKIRNTQAHETDNTNWKPSDWKLNIAFPNGPDKMEFKKTIKIHLSLSSSNYDIVQLLDESMQKAKDAKEAFKAAEQAYNDKAAAEGVTEEELAPLRAQMESAREAMEKAQAEDRELAAEKEEEIDANKGLAVKVDITGTRRNLEETKFKGKASLHSSKILKRIVKKFGIPTEYELDEIDCQQMMNDSKIFPALSGNFTMQGLAAATIDGYESPRYDFENYKLDIADRLEEVTKGFGYSDSSAFNENKDSAADTKIIEKGAVLRITTDVVYNESESKSLKRTLVTEIPFKVTDIQPIGPEYTLFIANSTLLCDNGDLDQEDGEDRELGSPVDLNNTGAFTDEDGNVVNTSHDATLAAGSFIAHNLYAEPGQEKPDYNKVGGDTGRVPGMIRINSAYEGKQEKKANVSKLRSFIGCFDEPQLTELNQMLTPNYKHQDNKFATMPSFYWANSASDDGSAQRFHEIEFPILFETRKVREKLPGFGLKHFMDIYNRSGFDIVMVPTLLYGRGHMEYPLGICAEGPIDSVFTRVRVGLKANVNVSPGGLADLCEIYYSYEPVCAYSAGDQKYNFNKDAMTNSTKFDPACYGMVGYECYDKAQKWNSNDDHKYMPANCYDAMQYAKKATRFYDTAGEFCADMEKSFKNGGIRDDDNNIILDGVYYIKADELELRDNITFKGKGLIVCKNGITISGNINKADDDTVIGIISRIGRITFDSGSDQVVHGAYFSNNSPLSNSPSLKIYGNLVCNDFVRKDLLEVEIFYDNKATCVTPLASMRKAGKFEPKRYHVAFADNWSKFAYEKTKEQQ